MAECLTLYILAYLLIGIVVSAYCLTIQWWNIYVLGITRWREIEVREIFLNIKLVYRWLPVCLGINYDK